jgi:hypothetical protein
MANDKISHLSINVEYKTLKALDPLANRTKLKQHSCDHALLYKRRLFKFLKPGLCPHITASFSWVSIYFVNKDLASLQPKLMAVVCNGTGGDKMHARC